MSVNQFRFEQLYLSLLPSDQRQQVRDVPLCAKFCGAVWLGVARFQELGAQVSDLAKWPVRA